MALLDYQPFAVILLVGCGLVDEEGPDISKSNNITIPKFDDDLNVSDVFFPVR